VCKPVPGLLLMVLLAAHGLFGQDTSQCSGSITSNPLTFEDNGGTGAFSGTVTAACGPLTSATPSVPWLSVTSATSAAAFATFDVQFLVAQNATGSSRSGSVTANFGQAPGGPVSFTFSLTQFATLTFANSSLPVGAVGLPYSAQLQVSGGSDFSRTFSITTGSLPAGLSLTGQTISGTPTAAGTSSFTAQVRDLDPNSGNPFSATQSYALTINPRFALTTTSLPGATVGVTYSASLAANGGLPPYVWSLVSGTLPPGLSLNPSTGAIGGTPGANSQGTYPFTIQTKDQGNETVSSPLTLNVAPSPLGIATSSLPPATEGTPYIATLAANGGTTPYSWSATGLPSWLNLSSSGQLSGTPPAAGSAGSYPFTVTVQDVGSQSTSVPLSLQVNATPLVIITTSPLPDGREGSVYGASFLASGGKAPYTWSATGLPAFLNLASSGNLTGLPTVGSAGPYSFTVTVGDALGNKVSGPFSLKVDSLSSPIALAITTSSLPAATAGVLYSATFAANGGTPPYAWSATGLPSWLSVSSAGQLSGIPPAGSAGSSLSFTVSVADSSGNKASGPFSLTVNSPSSPSSLTIVTSSLPPATAGVLYSTTFAANGGKLPYSWSATGLPSWLSLSFAGQLSGIPPVAAAGSSYNFTVSVSDSSGNKASGPFSLTVNSPSSPSSLTIVTSSLPPATAGVLYSTTFAANGGKLPYSWSATGLPSWLSLSSVGLLSGIPPAAAAGSSYNFTVSVGDSSGNNASGPFSLKVNSSSSPTSLAITTSLLPPATVGVLYNAAFAANGGTPPYAWSATGLPTWLSITSAGLLSGTPPAAAAGSSSNFTVTVGDSAGNNASGPFSLKVEPLSPNVTPPISITVTTPLPQATEGQAYSVTFGANGGTGPYTWSGIGLPGWANLSPAGVLSGTPPVGSAGAVQFTVTVKDSANGTQSTQVTLVVLAANGGPSITSPSPLQSGIVGGAYQVTLNATGGTPPYQWSGSGVPGGLTLASNGQLSGTPTSAGDSIVTAQATDANHNVAFAALSLHIAPSLFTIVTSRPLPAGEVSVPYSTIFQSSGGTRPQSWSLVSGALPPGLTLDSSGVVTGTPTEIGVFDFIVGVSEAAVANVGKVTALARGAPVSAGFEIVVGPYVTPDLILSCGSLTFESPGEGTAPLQTCSVISTVYSSIPFTASANVPWLSVSTSGITPGRIDVSADASGLAAGNHSAIITVSSPGLTSKTIQVSFITNPGSEASGILQVVPSALTLSSPGTPQFNQSLFVQNVGQGDLDFTASADVPWLTVSPSSGTLTGGGALTLQATVLAPSLTPGGYLGTIEIDSSTGATQIPASLLISGESSNSSGPRPKMTLSRNGILLQARQGNGVSGPAPSSFLVWGSNGTEIHYTVEQVGGAGWLSLVSPPQGTANSLNPGEVAFQAESAGLPKGAYYALLRVGAPEPFNAPLNFLVVLNVEDASTPPVPDTYPSGLVFAATGTANPPSQAVDVYTSSDKPVAYQVAVETESGGNWLSATPVAGVLATLSPAQLSVSANTAGLKPGIYRGGVNISISNLEVRTVNVTLIVPALSSSSASSHQVSSAASTPAASCTPANLVLTETGLAGNFSTPAAWPSYLAVQLADDCGNPVKDGFVVASFSNGDPPLSLLLSDVTMPVYSATWTPVNPVTQLTVTMQATASGLNPSSTQLVGGVTATPYPILSQNSTVNNLNQQPGAPLAPGTIVAIYGTALAPGPMTAAGPLPTALGGTSVVIGGELAPLFYVSGSQINAQLPADLVPGQQYQVLVLVDSAYSSPDTINIDPATPGVERQTNGQVIAQHQDASLVTPDSPAKPGEDLVIYLAGMGLTNPTVAAGALTPAAPLASVNVAATATLGGEPVKVQFAGLVPGLVGFYQINFQVPSDAKSGSLELQILQSGVASNTSVLVVGN
jgi:uncharacterized protein (TIGR03437 family)